MIYRNEDGSIYKIEIPIRTVAATSYGERYGKGSSEKPPVDPQIVNTLRNDLDEALEVINWLLKEIKNKQPKINL